MVVTLKPVAAGAGGGKVEHSFFAKVDASGVVDIDVMDADPLGPALPILRDVVMESVGVSFLHDAAPEGGTWTLRVQRRLAGTNTYIEVATFSFAK